MNNQSAAQILGRMGGLKTKKKYGIDFYKNMGKKGRISQIKNSKKKKEQK